jgi:hypothetical protein
MKDTPIQHALATEIQLFVSETDPPLLWGQKNPFNFGLPKTSGIGL